MLLLWVNNNDLKIMRQPISPFSHVLPFIQSVLQIRCPNTKYGWFMGFRYNLILLKLHLTFIHEINTSKRTASGVLLSTNFPNDLFKLNLFVCVFSLALSFSNQRAVFDENLQAESVEGHVSIFQTKNKSSIEPEPPVQPPHCSGGQI